MINKEEVRELTNKYIAEKDMGTQLMKLIGGVVMNVTVEYYGYDSVEDLLENDNVSDDEFEVFMSVVRDCMNKAVVEALS